MLRHPLFSQSITFLIESRLDIASSAYGSIIPIFRYAHRDNYRSLMCSPNITGGDIEILRPCAHTWEPIFRFCIDARCRGAINSHSIALPHTRMRMDTFGVKCGCADTGMHLPYLREASSIMSICRCNGDIHSFH